MIVKVYLRVSTNKQDTDNQKYGVVSFCKKNNITVSEWIEEIMTGTKDARDRKIWPTIQSLSKNDLLIVTEVSRIGRNLYHIMEVLKYCMDRGIIIKTVKEGYTLGDDIQSKVMAFAFGIAAEIERNLISQRTKEGLQRRKSEGVILGRPKGKKSSQYKLDENKNEIANLLSSNISYSAIARILNCHRLTVSNYVKTNNMLEDVILIRNRNNIIKYRDAGISTKDISRIYKVDILKMNKFIENQT